MQKSVAALAPAIVCTANRAVFVSRSAALEPAIQGCDAATENAACAMLVAFGNGFAELSACHAACDAADFACSTGAVVRKLAAVALTVPILNVRPFCKASMPCANPSERSRSLFKTDMHTSNCITVEHAFAPATSTRSISGMVASEFSSISFPGFVIANFICCCFTICSNDAYCSPSAASSPTASSATREASFSAMSEMDTCPNARKLPLAAIFCRYKEAWKASLFPKSSYCRAKLYMGRISEYAFVAAAKPAFAFVTKKSFSPPRNMQFWNRFPIAAVAWCAVVRGRAESEEGTESPEPAWMQGCRVCASAWLAPCHINPSFGITPGHAALSSGS
mmetsp:Transcript_26307/g.66339  ORF Transcript_26307/g.66339 Transcript_26307/m.66339 type:complete len:336 (-) Transcript_26307:360-1367(-)